MMNTIVHHNIGHGGWDDVGSQFMTIQGNHFYTNESAGYSHEIGCDVLFSGNELDHGYQFERLFGLFAPLRRNILN